MSSKTNSCAPSGSSAPRATRLVACCPAPADDACNSKGCCQWSSPWRSRSPKNARKYRSTAAAKSASPGTSDNGRPSYAAMGARRMRVAPGLEERMIPPSPSTITPAVRLSRMVCRFERAASTLTMLCSTAARASASCCVIMANDRVRPPSSSLPGKAAFGLRLPAATSRTPSASTSNGRASWLPSNTASSTAPNTARKRLSVSVPTYMRRRPPRASARS